MLTWSSLAGIPPGRCQVVRRHRCRPRSFLQRRRPRRVGGRGSCRLLCFRRRRCQLLLRRLRRPCRRLFSLLARSVGHPVQPRLKTMMTLLLAEGHRATADDRSGRQALMTTTAGPLLAVAPSLQPHVVTPTLAHRSLVTTAVTDLTKAAAAVAAPGLTAAKAVRLKPMLQVVVAALERLLAVLALAVTWRSNAAAAAALLASPVAVARLPRLVQETVTVVAVVTLTDAAAAALRHDAVRRGQFGGQG